MPRFTQYRVDWLAKMRVCYLLSASMGTGRLAFGGSMAVNLMGCWVCGFEMRHTRMQSRVNRYSYFSSAEKAMLRIFSWVWMDLWELGVVIRI
jgi:hypothetical protein